MYSLAGQPSSKKEMIRGLTSSLQYLTLTYEHLYKWYKFICEKPQHERKSKTNKNNSAEWKQTKATQTKKLAELDKARSMENLNQPTNPIIDILK